ncbi:DUF4142 domain-containing protein [Streptomyces sp. 8K308]|uniref:DUF4142 domain-containing protein n=1 Tax=Streptomyces sp. 8K308 TaxID=2530388 RepID=UPI001042D315|nr:DUF4142 domain-containing protein [Streptomyces sp. 8K308]TDC07164.1 DUF4142 domain-containing protein [Streptomyces sp. 8K308]
MAKRRSGIAGAFTSAHTVGTALVIGALALTLAALLIPVSLFERVANAGPSIEVGPPMTFTDDGRGTLTTQYGPLTALDRDFVRRVRMAGLWEGPAGQQAIERAGDNEALRTAGEHLVDGHALLDEMSVNTGRELGIDLPTQPSEQLQANLDRFSAASGAEYEYLFANILRRAHGQVFGLVAQVRHSTENSMVRELADQANETVLDHITHLELTGLVDYALLTD